MNALRGGLGVLLLQAGFWLCPPDHDPKFMSLPGTWQALVLLSIALIMALGVAIFFWGVFAEEPWKQSKCEEAVSISSTPRNTAAE